MARGILLMPHVGEFRSNQIGVFTGSMIILVIALVFVRWIVAIRTADLLPVGGLWLVLTLGFEVSFGRFVVGASWERLAADYNVREGGLLPFGMLVLLLSPLIAGKLLPRPVLLQRLHHDPVQVAADRLMQLSGKATVQNEFAKYLNPSQN